MLTPYTTNEDVRATLGVTEQELTDATLALDIYGKNLTLELDQIKDSAGVENNGALATAFVTVSNIAEATRTASQRRLYDAVVLFAPYPVALHLETALPLFAPKGVTDGKAGLTRHSESPFKAIFDNCRQNFERFRQNLTRAWAVYNSSVAVAVSLPQLIRVSSPATDPVTGA